MKSTTAVSVLALAMTASGAAIAPRQLTDCNPKYNTAYTWNTYQLCVNYNAEFSTMTNLCDRDPATPSGAVFCGTHFADTGCPIVMPYAHGDPGNCCNGMPQLRCCNSDGSRDLPVCSTLGPLSL